MGSVCQCLFQLCCGANERSQEANIFRDNDAVVSPMTRGGDDDDYERDGLLCHEEQSGIHELFRRLRDRWAFVHDGYDIMEQEETKIPASPLRQAKSFDSSFGTPCIHTDEVVLPGSQLQKEMAAKMAAAKLPDDVMECVVCMEPFDASNPRMPTLCGCGENKTYFHLPCLYQWLEQSSECPSCRQTLTWEEF